MDNVKFNTHIFISALCLEQDVECDTEDYGTQIKMVTIYGCM
jgi:hypothetical protein